MRAEWVIPPLVLREGAYSHRWGCPEQDGQKRNEMKLRNTTATTPSQGAAREAAILQGLDLVSSLAKRFRRRVPPSVTFDDLASAGTVGLIQAVDRFDHTRGLKFKTYAQHRISGAMLDFLRSEDPLSRTERNRVRQSSGIGVAPVTVSLDLIALRRLAAPAQPAFTTRREVQTARRCLSPRERSRNRAVVRLRLAEPRSRGGTARQREPRLSDQAARTFKASLAFVSTDSTRAASAVRDPP